MDLASRLAVVTGSGGSGSGRAIALRFAREGAAVVVSDIDEAGGHETVRLIRGENHRAAFCRASSPGTIAATRRCWSTRSNTPRPHRRSYDLSTMTADEFRRIALSLPGAEEKVHMGHPDFRVGGKIFATLGYPDAGWGMVKLTPEEQRVYVAMNPGTFVPVKGAWGVKGCTSVHLRSANEAAVHEAMERAWRAASTKKKAAPKKRGRA